MYSFIEAHKEVMQEIRRLEKSMVGSLEEAYTRDLQIKALHARGNAIRISAKEEQKRTKDLPTPAPTKIQKLKNMVGEYIHLLKEPFITDKELGGE